MLRELFFLVIFYLGSALPSLGQANFYAVLPILKEDVAMSPSLIANMMSMTAIFFSAAKVMVGSVIDLYGPRAVWSLAVIICGVCLIGIATADSGFPVLVVVCWLVYRFFHGFCRTSMIVALSARFHGSAFPTTLGIISTSGRIGSVLGGLLASSFLGSFGGWRKALQISAAGCLMQGIALLVLLTPVKKNNNGPDDAAKENKNAAKIDKKDGANANIDNVSIETNTNSKFDKPVRQARMMEVLVVAFSSSRMLLFLPFCALVYPAGYSLQDLFPSYFVTQGMPAVHAARVSSGWPAGMALSLPLAGFLAGKCPKLAAALMTIGVGVSGALMLLLSQLDFSSPIPEEAARAQFMAQALLCVMGFCFAPAVYLTPAEFATTYGGEHNKGVILSSLDFVGNMCAALFNVALPSLLSRVGWGGVLTLCAAFLVLSAFLIGYLHWWQLVEPVRELVAGPRFDSSKKDR